MFISCHTFPLSWKIKENYIDRIFSGKIKVYVLKKACLFVVLQTHISYRWFATWKISNSERKRIQGQFYEWCPCSVFFLEKWNKTRKSLTKSPVKSISYRSFIFWKYRTRIDGHAVDWRRLAKFKLPYYSTARLLWKFIQLMLLNNIY